MKHEYDQNAHDIVRFGQQVLDYTCKFSLIVAKSEAKGTFSTHNNDQQLLIV